MRVNKNCIYDSGYRKLTDLSAWKYLNESYLFDYMETS